MKKLLLVASVAFALPVMAQQLPDLSTLTITPAEQVAQNLAHVELNGSEFQVNAVPVEINGQPQLKAEVLPGEEVYDVTGFNAYTVTGEIIVKLNKTVDFTQFNQDNDLIVKQAYKEFYILKSVSNKNMLPLLDALKQLDGVESVTLELATKGVIAK